MKFHQLLFLNLLVDGVFFNNIVTATNKYVLEIISGPNTTPGSRI